MMCFILNQVDWKVKPATINYSYVERVDRFFGKIPKVSPISRFPSGMDIMTGSFESLIQPIPCSATASTLEIGDPQLNENNSGESQQGCDGGFENDSGDKEGGGDDDESEPPKSPRRRAEGDYIFNYRLSTLLFVVTIVTLLFSCICLLLRVAISLPKITGDTLTGLCSIIAVLLTFIYKALLCLREERVDCGKDIEPAFLQGK